MGSISKETPPKVMPPYVSAKLLVRGTTRILAPYFSSLWLMSRVAVSAKLMTPTTVATPIIRPAKTNAALLLRRMRCFTAM